MKIKRRFGFYLLHDITPLDLFGFPYLQFKLVRCAVRGPEAAGVREDADAPVELTCEFRLPRQGNTEPSDAVLIYDWHRQGSVMRAELIEAPTHAERDLRHLALLTNWSGGAAVGEAEPELLCRVPYAVPRPAPPQPDPALGEAEGFPPPNPF